MKKYFLHILGACALIACSFMPISVSAETVTQKEAKKVAMTFFNEAFQQNCPAPEYVYNGRELTTDRLFAPFYVFNLPSKKAYVIISAENKAFPVLAYNLTETFNPNKISDGQRTLLNAYARDIEHIRYDTSTPYEAIEAWQGIQQYVRKQLAGRAVISEPVTSLEERADAANNAYNGAIADDLVSDIYSPDQWMDVVDSELAAGLSDNTAIIGFFDNNRRINPLEVFGKKGDFYAIADGSDKEKTLYRLHATEILSAGQLVASNRVPYVKPSRVEIDEVVEEQPFAFIESILEDARNEQEKLRKAAEIKLTVSEPVIHTMGSGRFMIEMPEETVRAMVFNIGGSMVRLQRYSGSTMPVIDIMADPAGIYIATLTGVSGTPYTIKLVR